MKRDLVDVKKICVLHAIFKIGMQMEARASLQLHTPCFIAAVTANSSGGSREIEEDELHRQYEERIAIFVCVCDEGIVLPLAPLKNSRSEKMRRKGISRGPW